jgi:hypothetical protein
LQYFVVAWYFCKFWYVVPKINLATLQAAARASNFWFRQLSFKTFQDGWPEFLQCNNSSVFRTESASLSSGNVGGNGLRKKVPTFHSDDELTCQNDQVKKARPGANPTTSEFSTTTQAM